MSWCWPWEDFNLIETSGLWLCLPLRRKTRGFCSAMCLNLQGRTKSCLSAAELLLCVIYKDGERKLPAERSPICCIRKTSEGVICVYSFYDVGESNCHFAPAQPHSGHLALQSCHSGKEVSKPESARPESHKGLKKHLTSITWLHMPWNLTYMFVCVEAFNFLLYVRKELELLATTHWPAATTSSSGKRALAGADLLRWSFQ